MTKLELAVYNELLRTYISNNCLVCRDTTDLFVMLTDNCWDALTEDDRDEIEGWFCGTGITDLVDKVCTQAGLHISSYVFEQVVDLVNTRLSRY